MQQRVIALHLQNSHTLCTKKDHVLDILITAWSLYLCLSLPYVYIQLFLCMYNQAAIQKLMVFAALIYRQYFKFMYCLQISDIFFLVWCFYIEVTWSCWSSSGLCTWVNEQVLFFFSLSSPSSMSPCSKSCGQEDSHTHLSLTYIKVLCLTAFSTELWADHQPIDIGTHTTTSRTQNSEHMTTQNIVTILHWS
jgi:hypothetical protein